MKVRWSGTMLHKKRPVEGRFFAYKGAREAKLRNPYHIYIPSKSPFDKGGLIADHCKIPVER